jgi:hypothetical protein
MQPGVSIAISISAFLFSVASFAWLHFRRRDAATCTVIGSGCDFQHHKAIFQFSIANLGTHALLLKHIGVSIHFDPVKKGMFFDRSSCKPVPQVLKAGEMTTIYVESPWDETFLEQAVSFLKDGGEKGAKLYFEATVVLWNPKGKRLINSRYVGTYETNLTDRSSFSVPDDLVFQIPR